MRDGARAFFRYETFFTILELLKLKFSKFIHLLGKYTVLKQLSVTSGGYLPSREIAEYRYKTIVYKLDGTCPYVLEFAMTTVNKKLPVKRTEDHCCVSLQKQTPHMGPAAKEMRCLLLEAIVTSITARLA